MSSFNKALGFDASILVLTTMSQGSCDGTTAFRIRQYFDHSAQDWVAKNVQNFDENLKLNDFLLRNGVDGVVAINALETSHLVQECAQPYILILSTSEIPDGTKDSKKMELITLAIQKAAFVVANTGNVYSRAIKLWPNLRSGGKLLFIQRAVITRPGSPLCNRTWMDKYRLEDNVVLFTMVAKIHPNRDLLHIIPAFTHWHQLHSRHPFLIIVGPKVDEEYAKEFFEVVDGCPGVIYIGSMDMRETHRLMADSCACVNSSISGGPAMSVLEAMDLGVPVIARNIPGHTITIEDENSGLIYTSPEEFITKAERLLDNDELRQRLIVNARLYVNQRHCPTKEKTEYTDLALKLKSLAWNEDTKDGVPTTAATEDPPKANGETSSAASARKVRFQVSVEEPRQPVESAKSQTQAAKKTNGKPGQEDAERSGRDTTGVQSQQKASTAQTKDGGRRSTEVRPKTPTKANQLTTTTTTTKASNNPPITRQSSRQKIRKDNDKI